ncbi:MAG: AAA family ATPase [Planctomycetes bacterium]|nr:AAA family ATPase [Planctomycetota bacterium]
MSDRDTCAQSTLDGIEVLIRARYPVIYIVSWEEQRVQQWLAAVAAKRGKRVWEWSFSTGLVQAQVSPNGRSRGNASKDPAIALDEVVAHVEPALYLFKDLHPFLTANNFAVVRKLKETAIAIKDSYKTVVLVSPLMQLPPDLEKEVTVVDFPLPGQAEFSGLLDRIVAEVEGQPNVRLGLDADSREQLLKAALGLTLNEAENVFAKTIVNDGSLTADDIESVFAEKRQIIRKSGLLDYYDVDTAISQVGGLDQLKQWLANRALAFTDKARTFGLPPPKGVLLLGIQGCGKSLCAKAVASMWRMPLLRLDVGRMFGSLMGSSEENMRRALQVAESVAPVVLWLDEIDKALAGTKSSGSDNGTTARVFGTFLTWLSEKSSSVFVIATANDISDLPPELLRKGRFDEMFFVDLPNAGERRDILAIHLDRRGRDPKAFDLERLAQAANGFSGAEIEQAIVAALFEAFAAGGDIATAHIDRALRETVPLSKTMETEITRLREWATGRARPATFREGAVDAPRRKIEL